MRRPIPIYIAGQRYLVRSDADENYVQLLASHVDSRVNMLKGSRLIATQADVVLAALQLADELQHEKQRGRDLKRQVRERSERMLQYLSRISGGAEPGPGNER